MAEYNAYYNLAFSSIAVLFSSYNISIELYSISHCQVEQCIQNQLKRDMYETKHDSNNEDTWPFSL